MRAVVIGSGVAGLGAALALGRAGHDVTILERDHGQVPESPDHAFDEWHRRGAPQVRHSHAFLARSRNLLLERAPDVLDALYAAGATELRFTDELPQGMPAHDPFPGDDELVAIACRRITFEWVLRRAVLAEPAVSLVDGVVVDGLLGEPALVSGVRAGDREFAADVVIDASGRRSGLTKWLGDIGAPAPEDDEVDCGIVYLSRFFRLRPGQEPPPMEGPIGSDLGYLKYAIFLGDNRTFSITFGVDPHDERFRPRLLKADAFDAAARALPATAAWVESERAQPITGVEVMAGLRNRRRRFVVGGEPVALGVHAVGDAAIHTNPLYGRGCSLGLVHAYLLADLLEEHGTDHRTVALALDAATRREIEPWYDASVAQDLQSQAPAGDEGAAMARSLLVDGVMPAARTDPVVWRAFIRAFNLLTSPEALMSDPDLAGRVLQVWQDRDQRPPITPDGPPADEMLAILDEVAA